MLRTLKHMVPLPVRTRLKWLGYAVQDVVGGKREARVPAKRDIFIGGGDFIVVGDDFFQTLKRHGLTPHMAVLDVGCGQGRMARPLVDYLSPQGRYAGFDIVKSGVDWCQNEYADLPNFAFHHADIYNKRYNPRGPVMAENYSFPHDNSTFDFVFLTSVFTHMKAADVENYLSEIERVLKPGGRAIVTWFLLNETSREAVENSTAKLDFRFEYDEISRTTVKSQPEAAISFEEAFVRRLYVSKKLAIADINYGHWARETGRTNLQDMIIADKPV